MAMEQAEQPRMEMGGEMYDAEEMDEVGGANVIENLEVCLPCWLSYCVLSRQPLRPSFDNCQPHILPGCT